MFVNNQENCEKFRFVKNNLIYSNKTVSTLLNSGLFIITLTEQSAHFLNYNIGCIINTLIEQSRFAVKFHFGYIVLIKIFRVMHGLEHNTYLHTSKNYRKF